MKKVRKQNRTLLVVGEGKGEESFLSYLKSCLVFRGAGFRVTIKNAKGKGAKGVVDWTIRQKNNADYDHVVVLLDTDKDWGPAVAKRAQKNKIEVLTSEPCFEAMMLRHIGVTPQVGTSHLKRQFAGYVNGDSCIAGNYATHFCPSGLSSSRQPEAAITRILDLLTDGPS